MSKILGIIGAKGGVGKTTIALNLAYILSHAGRQVIVADMDLHTPHISLYLGYNSPATTIHDVLSCKIQLRDALYLHPSGMRVIPGATIYEAVNRVSYSEIGRVIGELREYGEMTILDAPSGLGPQLDAVLSSCDYCIIVTGDDLASHADALKSALRANELGKKVLGVIVNKTRGGADKSAIASFVGVPVLGVVPYDESVLDSNSVFSPVAFSHPGSLASCALQQIAAALSRQ